MRAPRAACTRVNHTGEVRYAAALAAMQTGRTFRNSVSHVGSGAVKGPITSGRLLGGVDAYAAFNALRRD